jgi:long-chain acyl-CoA synthetase
VGPPVENTELELRDKNDEGVGEVWVRGPTVMKGYLDAPELTAEVLVDGWLRTGDLGTIDAAGHLKLLGRKKNMIVTAGGKNVYPEDIENAFGDLKDVEEYSVLAANFVWPTGKLTGEELILVLRPKTGVAADEALLEQVKKLNAKLNDYKRVHGVVVVSDEFPRTASQKIKRDDLASKLRAGLRRDEAIVRI